MSFCNLISEATSQRICCILFIRGVTGSCPYSREEFIQGHKWPKPFQRLLTTDCKFNNIKELLALFRYDNYGYFLKV